MAHLRALAAFVVLSAALPDRSLVLGQQQSCLDESAAVKCDNCNFMQDIQRVKVRNIATSSPSALHHVMRMASVVCICWISGWLVLLTRAAPRAWGHGLC